jgi:hypothetical protein
VFYPISPIWETFLGEVGRFSKPAATIKQVSDLKSPIKKAGQTVVCPADDIVRFAFTDL